MFVEFMLQKLTLLSLCYIGVLLPESSATPSYTVMSGNGDSQCLVLKADIDTTLVLLFRNV